MSLMGSDKAARFAFAAAATLVLASCSNMQMGSPEAKTAATGSAGGANSENANRQLERCSSSLGTIAVVEDTNASWYGICLLYTSRCV